MRLVFLGAATLFISGCACGVNHAAGDGGAVDAGADSISYTMMPRAHVLEPGDLAALQSDDGGVMTFSLAGASDTIKNAARKDVLVGGVTDATPKGFIRLVAQTAVEGNTVTVTTVEAPIQLAFKNLHLKARRSSQNVDWSKFTPVTEQPLSTHFESPDVSASLVVFDGDGDESTTDDQVRASLTSRAQFDLFLGVDFDWDALDAAETVAECLLDIFHSGSCKPSDLLPEFKAGFEVNIATNNAAVVEGTAYLPFEREFTIVPEQTIDVIPIGPVVVIVDAAMMAKASGQASSHFKLGLKANAVASSEYTFSSKHAFTAQSPTEQHEFAITDKEFSLSASARVSAGPRIKARIYGVIGPSAELDAFGEVTLHADQTPCITMYAGLSASLGVQFGLPGWDFIDKEYPFDLLKTQVATADCPIPAEAPRPAGAGPGLQELQNPTFSPWARVFTAPMVRSAVTSDLQWTNFERTIDGRYAVTGKPFGAIIKFDDTGATSWGRLYKDGQSAVSPARTTPSADGHLFSVSSPRTLIKVSQAGTLRWAREYDVPNQTDEVVGLYGDSDNNHGLSVVTAQGEGAVVFGSVQPVLAAPVQLWRVEVDGLGTVVSSLQYSVAGYGLYPVAAIPVDADVIVVMLGDVTADSTKQATVVFRIAPDGSVVWATRIDGCAEAGLSHFLPVSATRLTDGTVAMVGHDGDYDKPALFRIKPDGTAGAASVTVLESLSAGTFSSLVELPGQALVAAGEYQYRYEGRYFTLFGLDYQGQIQWQHSYRLMKDGAINGALTCPGMVLTDDGAVLAVANLDPNTTGYSGGGVLAMKVPAKNGLLPDTPGISRHEFPGAPATCTAVSSSLTVTVHSVTATQRTVALDSSAAAVSAQ